MSIPASPDSPLSTPVSRSAGTIPAEWIEPDIFARIERNDWLLKCVDLRDEVRRDAPDQLAALAVDRPHLRWRAARAAIRAAHIAALRDMDLRLRHIFVLMVTQDTWMRRGSLGFAPSQSDFVDAQLTLERLTA